MTAAPHAELARVVGVEKRFGAVHAVKAVSCTFRAGAIHAVCGENGAGKSTVLKLVAGMLVPDEGEVVVFGAPLAPHTPREAIRRGVAMVLQHFALVPVFTTLENIILGAEPGRNGMLDLSEARRRAEAIGAELGTKLPLDARVETLGVGDRQRIEIARALFREANLVILDEPTALLTKNEALSLYATMRRLADAGKGIVVVTHKMDEVKAHADVVSVMRRGELVFTRPIDRNADVAAQVDEVTRAIMGAVHVRTAAHAERPVVVKTTEPVLVMKDVRVGQALAGVSMTLHPGEIVGIAGVEGNGQTELVAVLAGDRAPDEGTVTSPSAARSVVREDRHAEGLVLDATLRDNIVLGELGRFVRVRGLGILDGAAIDREAQARLERSGAPASLDRMARTLSGGNQQKIVVTRALSRPSEVVVAAQPTRGVDLAASLDIHGDLVAAAARGAGVIVVSSDLDELRKLSSRILVLARGAIVAEMPPTASDDELGRAMLGLGAPAT